MRVYMTHCSAKKDATFKHTDTAVTPDVLYTSAKTQAFIRSCKAAGVTWAIFSDYYGVWFPDVRHGWYEKHPKKVGAEEYRELLADFDTKLRPFEEIWFYYNPGRFHPLYNRLLRETNLQHRVHRFTHLREIV